MRIGIVGHAADKFTTQGKANARAAILEIILDYKLICLVNNTELVVVSGHCPIGGVDIWAEQLARECGIETDIKAPKEHSWSGKYGYKARNLDIARDSDKIYVLLADSFPPDFKGKKFTYCYHCKTDNHIKSGGCWTAHQAIRLGRVAEWVIIKNDG